MRGNAHSSVRQKHGFKNVFIAYCKIKVDGWIDGWIGGCMDG